MNSAESSIAVVIPAYDREGYIGGAIESALAQELRAHEIIVVDDGSTDHTARVARSYGDAIRMIQQPHRGVSAARNAGVESSSAEYIAFLDSDDFWQPDHLDRMARAISATTGRAWLYFSDLQLHPSHGGSSIWAQCGFEAESPFDFRETDKDWLFAPRQPMTIQASVIRRDAYLSVGGSDIRLARRGDTHLIFKLGLGGQICAVAGIAGEWTAGAANSLTRNVSPTHPVYLHCTTVLYADLIDACEMTRRQRGILQRRLAASHFSLARQAGMRAPHKAASHLGRAVQHDPAVLARRIGGRLTRTVSGRSNRHPRTRGPQPAPSQLTAHSPRAPIDNPGD